ncbi:hypothetical protein GQ43DRAFT_450656 [Delitschia confertaspora ATCC 74209]|uniref:NAD(P)-binding domain-containing protein n=1 Tax=Delitschia confertaspora ATCC 74209 TaxID=1513339 RepID=A0A9P4MQF6_9PLEO|nr:hypothetical protein GQ43DRAFT_450656 [Delitschia confertaspora ATCC 74209]
MFSATGAIGPYILAPLIKVKYSFTTVPIPTSGGTLKGRRGEVTLGDVNDKDVVEAYKGCDTIISALGRNALSQARPPPRRSLLCHPNLLYLQIGDRHRTCPFSATEKTEKPHQAKLTVRKFIRDNIRRLNIAYLVTEPYLDAKAEKVVLINSKDGTVSFITIADMGTLLVAAQHHPSETSLRVLKVNPFMAKSRTVHAEFEKQTGSEWNVEYTRLAKLKEGEKQEWEKRNSVAIVFTLRMIWTKGGTLYEKRDNGLIGIQNWKFWKARFRKQSRLRKAWAAL